MFGSLFTTSKTRRRTSAEGRREVAYQLWDVFTERPLSGNPLAVVLEAQALSDNEMRAVAKEFNLSETSFVLPSEDADVRARYFTPACELPMAGHPSIGTVYALEHLGAIPKEQVLVTLELGIGPVRMGLEREGERLTRVWMNQGVPELSEIFDNRGRVAAALGLEAGDLHPDLPVQLGSAGVPFLFVPVVSLSALARAHVTTASLSTLMGSDHKAVFIFMRHPETGNVRSRMLGAALGVTEDPATGSAHGPLGAYLATHGKLEFLEFQGDSARFVSRQGIEMGRPSRIDVNVRKRAEGFEVYVGGAAVFVGEGRLYL